MDANAIEKTCRWLEIPSGTNGDNHPIGIHKDIAAEIARLARLGAAVEADGCEHRCGPCDNVMTCQVHDCEGNPRFVEHQFCGDCGRCLNPQDEDHGGPCDACTCAKPNQT